VVQGGLRILEKIQNMQWATVHSRPHLTRFEVPQLLWRAARMRPGPSGLQDGAPA
jgi:hydroxysqualene synthase